MSSHIDTVRNAFLPHFQKLLQDRDELFRRLDRRRTPIMQRPMRAFCVAIRATDHRLAKIRRLALPGNPIDSSRAPHKLRIDVPLLRKLCKPIDVQSQIASIVAQKLGRHRVFTWRNSVNGKFSLRHIPLLAGRRGKPVPVIHAQGLVDPCARSVHPQDDVWGDLWVFNVESLPADFSMDLERQPHIGYGGIFRTWRWVCPGCAKEVITLYCPVDPPTVENWFDLQLDRIPGYDPELHAAPKAMSTFACAACHNLHGLCRGTRDSWNRYVSTLTTGLMYGSEIPRPDGWIDRRAPANLKLKTPRPTRRRDEVLELILTTDLTYPQMALKLNVTRAAIHQQVFKLHKRYCVHSREELVERVRLLRATEGADRPMLQSA